MSKGLIENYVQVLAAYCSKMLVGDAKQVTVREQEALLILLTFVINKYSVS